MLAVVLLVAVMVCDTSHTTNEIDADTIDVVSEIDALDWYEDIPVTLQVGVYQRDESMRTLSYRLDASLSTVRAGYTAQTSPIDQAPAGYWFSGSSGSSTVNLGDIGLFAGTGLLLGSAGIGFRSVRTVQMPHRSDTFIEPWKSRYRTPALRGIGVRTSIDSGAVTLGLVAGRSLSDAVTSYVAMAALHDPAYSLGVNVVLREPLSSVSGSCWFRSTSKARTFCAEIACTSQGLPAMQASYALRSPLISIGLSAWLCTDSIELPHGSLSAVSTRPRNTLGVAFSAGQTIRSLVGWNIWLLLKQSISRTNDAPFPESEISCRAEVRQTLTSQLHVVWRGQASRIDDGVTLNGIRTQQQVYRLGIQSTIERIIRPTLLWRARADVRWIWDISGLASSTSTRLEVIWRTHQSITLRARALQFASPSYLIAPRIIDYVSRDLQRMVYCNGYGLRWSLGIHWKWHKMMSISALATITTSPNVIAPAAELWLGLSGRFLPVPDMHLPQEENVER